MIARYGDRQRFMELFNPDLQMVICKDSELCFFGDAPVLSELNMAYGEATATIWLIPQLYDLSEYCGCRDKLQGKSLEECVSVIAAEFYYLKVSELMLFFHWFKSGRYGRFYGYVDPLVITTSLREFLKERNIEIDKRTKEEERLAYEKSKKSAISYEEFCKSMKRAIEPNPINGLVERMESKPKKTGKKYEPEHIREVAEGLVGNIYKADEPTLKLMKDMFKKDYECTPEEWLKDNS